MSIAYRKIIHVDMDAFFASVEQLDNPELRGKPIVVGYAGERGVVAAASYEARKFGVRSAMSSRTASRLCPHLVWVRGHYERYKEVSNQIHEIFSDYTQLIEPLSLDEAYLDVTEPLRGLPSATLLAQEIRARIFETTGLTASAGVSYCKFLAKVASSLNKPNGQAVILPQDAEAFLEKLPVEKFHGIGEATSEKMRLIGIRNGKDLKERPLHDLVRHFGKAGHFYYDIVRGIDERPVRPSRERKSIGAESTFSHDLYSHEEMVMRLRDIAGDVARRLAKKGTAGKTVTLKVKYPDFTNCTRSKTLTHFVSETEELLDIAVNLLPETEALEKRARLLGISVSNLRKEGDEEEEEDLPDEPTDDPWYGIQLEIEFPWWMEQD